ncbi:Helicase conserved C-terminal domain-containing protein [Marinobacter sp. LV10R510-11A]|uniref:DEAD/DEAH box helicase n=1 Tax=Marinobacter sp. LV10R510-11A TaxID=1415568 RepID=UPI000BB8A1F4|nr:DEAD/DEAH box helicase [Marinobacter sp. LV10R510-11A]SOB75602.1 Helicase conserved C-terminal domain-containing protein [Marinobacter sp. LV10R510-11A]
MTETRWGKLRPEAVTDWINFNRSEHDWHYQPDNRESMAAKQTEGVAYLWNLLSEHGVALLADEVGMGKTFQALGVAMLLWKMKPDAKILVMAPNRDICLHWRREFETLVRWHYRPVDHTVKNAVDGRPVPSVEMCKSLEGLDVAVNHGVGHFYLTTIHSLSGLLRGADMEVDPNKPAAVKAAEKATEIRKSLKSENGLGAAGFDLIVVDEAHYLRNIGGGSQRVAAARAFFGPGDDKLASKVLLLTATPSHTRLSDIDSIFSYFLEDRGHWNSPAERATELLQKYALRRMRLMEGRGKLHSKRHYRHEKGMAATFEGQPEAEGFFALYQKGLVTELNKKKEGKSLMYGYLEGFESVGRKTIPEGNTTSEEYGDSDGNDKGKGDYSSAPDTNLLMALTDSYYQANKEFPDHPKYGRLISECVPTNEQLFNADLNDLKHLVFVRRIPSVRELTQRLNERYDQLLGRMLLKALDSSLSDKNAEAFLKDFSRQEFDRFVSELGSDTDPDLDGDEDELPSDEDDLDAEGEDYLASRVAQLFVVKKGAGGQTDCANVRLRFTKPESLFSLFLEPASDYLEGGYTHFYGDLSRGRANYGVAARYERFDRWESEGDRREALGGSDQPETPYREPLYSFWPLVYRELPEHLRTKLQEWSGNRKSAAENFANYVKAGFLYASPVIVELYGWFVEFRNRGKKQDVQQWYREFYYFVKPKIKGSLMLRYFVAALETFESLCGKIIDHKLDDWRSRWRSLTRLTSPAWYASGENNNARQRLILGFNSPFYPNVLVSTSVFQEGVNLHMNCHQVHHYGIAGSPGDNEQRVGRIDRLFGCVNKRLEKQGAGELSIHYPYLKGSVDEDQVASFLERKHRVEERMDACLQEKFDSEYKPGASIDWSVFLRKPASHTDEPMKDPYSAVFPEVVSEAEKYLPHETHSFEDIEQALHQHLEQVCDPEENEITEAQSSQSSPRPLFIIDPVIKRGETKRHQPVFMTLGFSPRFSALVPETAYIVSFASPIANRESLKNVPRDKLLELINQLSVRYPLVRVAIDENAGNSYFYLSTRVNFPLFVKHGKLQWLSAYEIEMGLADIKQFSDEFEAALFHEAQDLRRDDVTRYAVAGPRPLPEGFNRRRDRVTSLEWEAVSGVNGRVDRLAATLTQSVTQALIQDAGHEGRSLSTADKILQLNNRFPFVNFRSPTEDIIEAQLNFPEGDFQDEERALLEAWFRYVVVSGD